MGRAGGKEGLRGGMAIFAANPSVAGRTPSPAYLASTSTIPSVPAWMWSRNAMVGVCRRTNARRGGGSQGDRLMEARREQLIESVFIHLRVFSGRWTALTDLLLGQKQLVEMILRILPPYLDPQSLKHVHLFWCPAPLLVGAQCSVRLIAGNVCAVARSSLFPLELGLPDHAVVSDIGHRLAQVPLPPSQPSIVR